MPSRMFGQYEATSEIARTALGRVWRAKGPGSTQPAFAAKLLDCGVLSFVADDSAVAARIDTFLEAVDVQSRAASLPDSRWAPVHAKGSGEDSAFYVSDLFPLNVARLVEGRAAARAQVLVTLVTGIAAALQQIKSSQGRWHGNLRPTNVFFDRDSDLDTAKIVLADPRATRELPEDKGERDDLRAIGQLIHQLVTHQPFEALGGWPVAPGPAWSRLGKVGEGWRELCSDLLHPDLDPKKFTLELLAERAASLTPPPRPVWRYVLAGAAAIALVVGAYLGWTNRPWKPLDWNDALWAEVCDNSEWYAAIIEGALATDVDDRAKRFEEKVQSGEARKKLIGEQLDALAGDPELVGVVAQFLVERAGTAMSDEAWTRFQTAYPGVDKDNAARALSELADARSRPSWMLGHSRRFAPAAKKSWTTEDAAMFRSERPAVSGGDLTRAAYGLRVAHFMQAELRLAVETRQASLMERVRELVQSGPPAPVAGAEVLADADAGTLWRPSERLMVDRLRALANAGDNAKQLGSRWTSIQNGIASIAQAQGAAPVNDAVLGSLQDSVRNDVTLADQQGGLRPVLDALARWDASIAAAAQTVAPNARAIDWEMLPSREGSASVYASAASSSVTPDALGQWTTIVADQSFWLVAAPRPAIAIDQPIASAESTLASIEEIEREFFSPEIASFSERAVSLRDDALQTDSIRWINRNRAEIEQRVTRLNADAASLASEASALVAAIVASAKEQSERWLTESPASLTSVEAIARFWSEERERIRARVGPQAGGSPGELRAALRNMRGVLFFEEDIRTGEVRADGWSRAVEKWGGQTPESLPAGWIADRWAEAVRQRRELIAARLIASLRDWDARVPLLRWAGAERVESESREAWASADEWLGEAAVLAADFRRLENLRDSWHGAPESPADGGQSIGQIVAKWRTREEHRLTLLACQAPLADADRLATIEGLDRQTLALSSQNEQEPHWFRFAAWRALGSDQLQPGWPIGAAELRSEIQTRNRLLDAASPIGDEDRKRVLVAEIERAGPPRWSRALLSGGAQDLAEVMALRDALGVKADSAGLVPAAAINLAMFEFAAAVRRVEDEERVKAMGSELVTRVRPLLQSIDPAQASAVSSAIQGIDEIARGRDTRKSLAEILAENGPGINQKWRILSTEGTGPDGQAAPEIIRYARPGSDKVLTFVRADVDDPEPVYLCTEEVSIGLVRDIAASVPGVRHGLTRMREWSKLEAPEDRRGIFTWQVRRFNIEPWDPTYPWWNDSNVSRAEAFPTGMEPSPPPTLDTPVNWIEPEAAEQLAAVIGCRLPTSAEWRMALAKERTHDSSGPGANLRDATFARFTEHVAILRQAQPLIVFPHAKGAYDPGDVENRPAAAATSADDGSLWFEPQGHPERGVIFKHLIGNVGEFVDDQPGERGGYGVVGGSAMSISSDPETTKAIRTRAAYSDVGFRLVFQAKDLKPAMWAAMLKEFGPEVPYLFASQELRP